MFTTLDNVRHFNSSKKNNSKFTNFWYFLVCYFLNNFYTDNLILLGTFSVICFGLAMAIATTIVLIVLKKKNKCGEQLRYFLELVVAHQLSFSLFFVFPLGFYVFLSCSQKKAQSLSSFVFNHIFLPLTSFASFTQINTSNFIIVS